MRLISSVFWVSAALFSANTAFAAPWIKTDDQYLQQSIQQLANAGLLSTPVNTWPVMWQPILQDLAKINVNTLTSAQLHAYHRVKSAASFNQANQINSVALQGSSDPLGQSGVGQQYLQKAAVRLGTEAKGNNWSGGIYKQFRQDAYDANSISENASNWDGSYGAYTAGNWVLISAIHNQWWGPAVQSSFNFNTTQRPLRSIQVSRLNPNESLHETLDWLGPISMNVQYGTFAGTAPLRHATYYAARVGFKPISEVEVSLTARGVKPKQDTLQLVEPYSYLLPTENVNTYGADFRHHVTSQLAWYGEVSHQVKGDSHDGLISPTLPIESATGYLLGTQYHVGNQDVLLRFFAEFQAIPKNYNQWLFIEPGKHNTPLKSQAVLGLQVSGVSGKSGYVTFSQRKYSDQYNVLNNNPITSSNTGAFNKGNQLTLGYQQPLFNGLLQVNYQLEKGQLATTSTSNTEPDNPLNSNINSSTNNDSKSDYSHAIGARWEWRW